jgi:hypothetical protein
MVCNPHLTCKILKKQSWATFGYSFKGSFAIHKFNFETATLLGLSFRYAVDDINYQDMQQNLQQIFQSNYLNDIN